MEQELKPEQQNNKENKNGIKKAASFGVFAFIFEIIKIVIIASVIVLPIRYFLFQPFIVKGESMVPNFESGDYLIVDEISYKLGNPQRGDVVVFNYPLDTTQRFIKRVIGLPGETVEVNNGKVKITEANGNPVTLDEKYIPKDFTTNGNLKITLKSDQYFVMGDNREFSFDSRSWGVLPRKDMIGKAVLRLYPLTNIKTISAPNY